MFERPRWMLWSAMTTLTFVSFGQAHGSDAGGTLSQVHSDRGLSDAAEASGEAHAENPTIEANGRNGADVIEEIVVVGSKKKQHLNPDRNLTTRPAIEKPSQIDLRLLPVYDPEEANRHFSLVQHDERLRGVGVVTLFRLSFGR